MWLDFSYAKRGKEICALTTWSVQRLWATEDPFSPLSPSFHPFFLLLPLSLFSFSSSFIPLLLLDIPQEPVVLFWPYKNRFLQMALSPLRDDRLLFPLGTNQKLKQMTCLQQCQAKGSGSWRVRLWTYLENSKRRKWYWSTTGCGDEGPPSPGLSSNGILTVLYAFLLFLHNLLKITTVWLFRVSKNKRVNFKV